MTRGNPSPLRVRFGEFELDEANAMLRRSGQAIDLALNSLRAPVRPRPPLGFALEQAHAPERGLGSPLCERLGAKDRHQRLAERSCG